MLVQGPGGNTSLKDGDRLWVKASGRWLSEAAVRPISIPLSLSAVRETLATSDAEDLSGAVMTDIADPAMRPSIETALHALMPQRIVVHAHALNSMATCVLADGEDKAAAALDAAPFRWAWVPYHRPGAPLARAVTSALQRRCDVLLLQNHGVVVGGESADETADLLNGVERRLELSPRTLTLPDPGELGLWETEAYEALPLISGLALDPELTALVGQGPLIPDQVVFLGGAAPVAGPGETLAAAEVRVHSATGITPVLIIVPGVGAFGRRDRTPTADSLIEALAGIAIRIPPGARVQTLSEVQTAELMGWDAEKYRQALNRAAHSG